MFHCAFYDNCNCVTFLPFQPTQNTVIATALELNEIRPWIDPSYKIVTTRTWYCMCVLCLTMCIFGCLWNCFCAHGYQSVSYEGLNTHMGKWQTVQGKHIIFYVWKNLTSKSNYLDVGYIHFYKCIVDLDDHVFSEMHYLHALNFRKVIKSMSKNFIV